MKMKRKLPILAEHSLANVLSARVEISTRFQEATQRKAIEAHKAITCHTGCASCCYHPVHISALEGVLLYRSIVARGGWTPSFKTKVADHANKARDLPYGVWLLSMLACPLLDEKTRKCTSYDSRPFACRVTVSMGDPHNCHPHRILDASIENKTEITAEFHARERAAISRHGLTMIIMPLSVALLVGEGIVRGDFDLEGADMALLRDYAENT